MLQVNLKVVGGKHDGQLIPLSAPKFLIGREGDCDLRPNSEMISRHHCALSVDDFSVRLRDLGSTNGTLVNGERIRGVTQLNAGDRVTVGKLEFLLVIGEESSVAPAEDRQSTVLQGETAELSSEETHFEMPSFDMLENDDSETKIISQQDLESPTPIPTEQPAPAQPVTAQPSAGQMPQPGMPQSPPGYPYPPQPMGYPYPMGYPPAGGYFPQYPQYPYPQPVVMGQPPFPPQPAAAPPSPATETPAEDGSELPPDVRLPDPSATGAEEQAAAAKGEASASSDEKNPSEHAADIIRQHMHRRPTVDE